MVLNFTWAKPRIGNGVGSEVAGGEVEGEWE